MSTWTRRRPAPLWAAGLTALLAAACVTRPMPDYAAPGEEPGVGPSLVVERFLRAANAKDLDTMGRLFGTRDGPISGRDPRSIVEQRMFTLAAVLEHREYKVEGEGLVPGRSGEARHVRVRLTLPDRQVAVPFVAVRAKGNIWLIERIGIEAITNTR